MVGERLEYTVDAKDNTDGAAESVNNRLGGLFDSLAGKALAVGAALLSGIEAATDRAHDSLRRLRILTGGGSDEQIQLFSDLRALGVGESDAAAAISALEGVGPTVGLNDATNETVARTLAGVSAVGADPTAALQALSGFGVEGQRDVIGSLNVAIVGSAQQGVDAATIISGLRNYGPVLASLGLNVLESAAFIADLSNEGIDVSRVSPALNRFIRDSAAEGVDARTAATAAFARLEAAAEDEAAFEGQELFGAEGGLRLTRAIRSGRVGLGDQLLPGDTDDLPTLESFIDPSNRELFQGFIESQYLTGNVAGRALAGVGGLLGGLPIVGGSFQGTVGSAFRNPIADESGTFSENIYIQSVLSELNTRAAEQTELQRQQLAATERGNTARDGYAAWTESRATDAGGLQQ